MGSSRRADLTADLSKRGVVLSLFPPPLFFSFVFLAGQAVSVKPVRHE